MNSIFSRINIIYPKHPHVNPLLSLKQTIFIFKIHNNLSDNDIFFRQGTEGLLCKPDKKPLHNTVLVNYDMQRFNISL